MSIIYKGEEGRGKNREKTANNGIMAVSNGMKRSGLVGSGRCEEAKGSFCAGVQAGSIAIFSDALCKCRNEISLRPSWFACETVLLSLRSADGAARSQGNQCRTSLYLRETAFRTPQLFPKMAIHIDAVIKIERLPIAITAATSFVVGDNSSCNK